MTDTSNTTQPLATKPLIPNIADDRLAFRSALDHLTAALTADWQVFIRSNFRDKRKTKTFEHDAADHWTQCLDALRTVRDSEMAHFELRLAALELIETTPGSYPHVRELSKCGLALREIRDRHKDGERGLYVLLNEAYMINEAHYANAAQQRPPVVN